MWSLNGNIWLINTNKTKTNLSVSHNSKTYIIGFAHEQMASRVRANLPSPIALKRSHYIDIAKDVKRMMLEYDIKNSEKVSEEIIVDVHAKLKVEKSQDTNQYKNTKQYGIYFVPSLDFLMYPFENNLGIVYAFNIQEEDSKNIIFNCEVVESSPNIQMFIDFLKY